VREFEFLNFHLSVVHENEKFELDDQTFSSIFGAKRYVPHEKTNLSPFLRYFKTKDTKIRFKKEVSFKICGMKEGKEEGKERPPSHFSSSTEERREGRRE
jgi:hypothetical protein